MMLVDHVESGEVPISDRGLNYGDGVWETIAVRQHKPKCLDQHLARLQRGIDALKIKGYSQQALVVDIQKILSLEKADDFILKLIVSRGSGGRGYATEGCLQPRYIASTHAMPCYPESSKREGVKLALCETRLSVNPQMAGFKHLNRLEQVMARSELKTGFPEGLVRDYDGYVIEGTMSNLFVVYDKDTVITPNLSRCGIEGVARACVIDRLKSLNMTVEIASIRLADLECAEALFLTNSVMRLWPVQKFQSVEYQIPDWIRELQLELQNYL